MPSRTRSLAADARMPALMVAAAAAVAALCVALAYMASPIMAIGVPVGLAVVAAVFVQPVYGLYAGVLTAPLESLNLPLGNVAGLSISEGIFLLAAVATIGRTLLSDRGWRAPSPPHLAFAALIVVSATGLAFAPDTLVVVKVVVMWSTYLVLSGLVASSGREELRRLLIVVAVAAGVLGAIAIPSAADVHLVGGGEVATNRATASFSDPNTLSFFLVLALAPALALALSSRGAARPTMGVAVVLILGALMATLSRGAIIGAAVSLVVMLALPAFRRLMAVLVVVLLAGAIAGGGALSSSREVTVVRMRLGTIGYESKTNPRLRIYSAAPSLVAAHPFLGVGEGNFPYESAAFGLRDTDGSTFEHAHDILLTIVAETGLIGLAAFLSFLGAIVHTIRRALRRVAGDDRTLVVGLIAGLCGIFVDGITDYPLRANIVMAVLMFEVGALVAYARGALPRTGAATAQVATGARR